MHDQATEQAPRCGDDDTTVARRDLVLENLQDLFSSIVIRAPMWVRHRGEFSDFLRRRR